MACLAPSSLALHQLLVREHWEWRACFRSEGHRGEGEIRDTFRDNVSRLSPRPLAFSKRARNGEGRPYGPVFPYCQLKSAVFVWRFNCIFEKKNSLLKGFSGSLIFCRHAETETIYLFLVFWQGTVFFKMNYSIINNGKYSKLNWTREGIGNILMSGMRDGELFMIRSLAFWHTLDRA